LEEIGEGNPVRVIEVFVDQLDLGELGSVGLVSSLVEALYLIYGYLNRMQRAAGSGASSTGN